MENYYSPNNNLQKQSLSFQLLLKGVTVFCLLLGSFAVEAQNTPVYPTTCPGGTSIYTVDHQDLNLGFLPGGFCVETELSGTLSGTQSTANYTVLNGAFNNTTNFIADGGALTFIATDDGDDADLQYTFCQPVTNPYIIIGPTGPEIGTLYAIFEADGTTPINVTYIDGQTGFLVQNGNEITTTINNRSGYVQIQDNTPRTSFIVNIVNGGTGGLDGFDIGVGVCMPDPPVGTMTCPYDLFMWKKDAYCAPVYRDANGVFYEKDQNNNNIASLGDELWTNDPICGELVLLEADCAIQDNSCTPDFTCDAVPVAVEYYEPMGSGCLYSTYWYDITSFPINDTDPGNQWSAIFSGTDAFGLPAHPSAPTQAVENCGLDWLGDNEGTFDFDDEGGGANEDEQLQMDGWLYVASHLECIQFRVGSSATDHSVGLYVGTDLNNMTFVAEENDNQAGGGNNASGVVGSYCIPNTVSTTNDACGWKILRVRIYAHDDDTAYDPAVDWSFNGGLTWDVVEEQWFVAATSASDNTPPTGVAGGGGGCNPIPTNLVDSDNVLVDLEGKLWQIPGNCNSVPTNLYEPNIPNGNNAEEGDHLSLIPYCINYNDDVNIDCEPCAIDIVVEGCACSDPDNMFAGACPQTVTAYQQTLVVNSDINTSYTITASSGISGLAGPFMTAGTSETYTFFATPGTPYSITIMGDDSGTSQTYEGLCSPPDACNCPPQPEICGDGLDNDCDGAVDAADSDISGNCMLDCDATPVEIQGREMQLDGKLTHQVWSKECGNTGCCPSSINPHSCALVAFQCTDVNGLPQHNSACGPADPCAPAGPPGAAGCTGNDVFTLLGSTHGQAPQFYSTAAEQTQLDGWLVLPPTVTCFELKVNHPRAWDAQAVYMGAGIASMNFVGATSFPPQENYTDAIDCQSDMNNNPNVTGENFQYDISSGATPITVAGCTWSVVRVRAYIFDESWYHVTPVQWNIGNGFETIPSRFFQSVGLDGWDTDNNKPTASNVVDTAPFCAYQDGDGDLFLQNGNFYALDERKCEQIVTNNCLTCPDNLMACVTGGGCVTPLTDPAGNPISDVPSCNLELFTITPRVVDPVAGNGLLTRYWDHNDGNCIDNEITNQSIFCAFNAFNANPACPGCLPQHPNNNNPTGMLNLTTLGVRDIDLPQDEDGDKFVIRAFNRRSGENAQQDGWLLVPPGFDCLEFRISSPQWDAGALYLGTDIDNMTLVGENVNARGEHPVDSFYYDIPANAPTLACPDCTEPLKYLRVRTYHHDNNMRANTVWEWNLGNGFVNVPMEHLFPVTDQCSNTLPTTCPTFSDGTSYTAVLEDLNMNQVADAGERWFKAPASWTSCAIAQNGFDVNMIPSMDLAAVGPCDQQVYIPCALCCMLEVTCPPTNLGSITCNTTATTAFPPATTEAEFEALGGDIADTPGPCGPLSITSTDSFNGTTCDGGTITRTYTVTDGNDTFMCSQTITVEVPMNPVITCPADITVQCDQSTMPANTGSATATSDCNPPLTVNITFSDVSTQTNNGSCSDQNYTITRTWLATDQCGRTDDCVQVITVEDTTPPVITCPANITIECTASTDPANTGIATATDNCSAANEINITSTDVSTQTNTGCGQFQYTITRTWVATDACGNASTCVQVINVVDTTPPVITCAPNQTLTCFESVPNPINTAAGFIAAGGTISDNCTIALSDFTVFSTQVDNGGSNCPGDARVVTRTYYVLDACGNSTTCTQTFTYLESTQGPVITSVLPTCYKYCGSLANPADSDITYTTDCSFDATVTITGPVIIGQPNCPGTIYRYTYTVTDDCGRTSAPVTRDFIIGNDGPTIECPSYSLLLECGDPNSGDYIDAHLAQVSANTSCELGYTITHFPSNFNNITCNTATVVTFVATDDCGRTASCTTVINISDNTAPVITSTYVDGVCNEAVCGSNVNFWFANWKSKVLEGLSATDACDSNISWTTSPNSSSPNQDCPDGTAETTVTWFANDNCGNAGEISYTFYVVPAQGPDPTGQIMGIVANEETETVEDVVVSLEGNGIEESFQTAEDGAYSFADLQLEENYAVTPYLNTNPLNGISSFDLVLITKHILQSELLDSPYKIIAADINKSGSVTSVDIVELRKLILHINEELPNNTSWRFIESAFVFPAPTNPFATLFPEAVYINGLTEEEQHDFVGVKVGDVNGSAVANAMAGADDRTIVDDLVFNVADQQLKRGETYDISFHADNFEAIHGYQFSLEFNQSALAFAGIKSGELSNLNESNFGLTLLEEGVITTSWTNKAASFVARDAAVFHLTFKAEADALLSEVIQVSSRYTKAEAYNEKLDLMNVLVRFDGSVVTNKFRLYQNTPNPFSQETLIGFELPETSVATLNVFDLSGKLLVQIEGAFEKGYNSISLSNNEALSTGVLYYQLVTPSHTATKKMIYKTR